MTLINKVLKERYKLTDLMAEGGMASVYKGVDLLLQRTVAVKVLKQNLSLDKEGIERFYREARSAAKLSHPNIVNIYDIGSENQIYFIVMEYLPGGTLDKLISKGKPLAVKEILRLGVGICDALNYAHEKGVIHRDIKAQNIMLSEDKQVKVVDFGIARPLDSGTMTRPGTIMGSVYFLSPEQAEGKESNNSSDIYSTGVLMYYLATATYPFDGENAVAIALKHIKETPVPPRTFNPGIPEKLEAIILKAMNKIPEDRYKTALDMLKELKSVEETFQEKSEQLIKDTGIKTLSDKKEKADQEKTIIRKSPPPFLKGGGEENIPSKKEQKEGRKMNPLVLVIIFGIIIVIGVFLGIMLSDFNIDNFIKPKMATVPSLVGKTETQAQEELDALGLSLDISSRVNNDQIPEGQIISQTPPGGTRVEPKSNVNVVISRGKGKIQVPNITGKNIEDARKDLNSLGLDLLVQEEEFSENYLPGTVISQDPLAGSEVEEKTQIKVKVCKKEDVIVPDLAGLTEEKAKEILLAKDLKLKISGEKNSDREKGLIISQAPSAGSSTPKKSEVEVFISSGPKMVTVPAITGITLAQAKESVKDLDITIKVKENQVPQDDEAIIESQKPLAGENMPQGGTIEITLKPKIEENMVTVPDVNGKLLFDAKNDLIKKILTIGTINETSSDKAPGTVLQQDPQPGTQVKQNTPVNLTVSKQLHPDQVTVPDLTGMHIEDALKELEKGGLRVGNVETRADTKAKGTVLSQDPPSGTNIDKGSSVNLIINQ